MSVCWGLPPANAEHLEALAISCVQCCGGFGNDAGDGGSVHLPPAKWPAVRPGDVLLFDAIGLKRNFTSSPPTTLLMWLLKLLMLMDLLMRGGVAIVAMYGLVVTIVAFKDRSLDVLRGLPGVPLRSALFFPAILFKEFVIWIEWQRVLVF